MSPTNGLHTLLLVVIVYILIELSQCIMLKMKLFQIPCPPPKKKGLSTPLVPKFWKFYFLVPEFQFASQIISQF
jgi:hypothetical protein